MSSTTQKHRHFIMEPMGVKPVTAVAGIGPIYGQRLNEAGFDKAWVLLGQFLVLKKNETLFVEWLKMTCDTTPYYATQCYKCLNDWCNAFL